MLEYYGCRQLGTEKVLCAAVCSHYEQLRRGRGKQGVPRPGARGILVIGPTRSNRLFLARALAHLVHVPCAHAQARALVEANSSGGVGEHLLRNLLVASDFDVEAAERGILYIDGVDQRDVQQPLLKLLEDTIQSVPPTGGRKHPEHQVIQIDTANILFICGDNFVGLDQLITRRGRHAEQPVTAEDLLAFGMLPELVSRLQVIVRLAPLSEETLVRIVSVADLKGLSEGGACHEHGAVKPPE